VGVINDAGARIHLIYNSEQVHESGNILLDHAVKYPGYTHAAFVVDDMARLVAALNEHDIKISGGPVVYGQGRRMACFFRDPDGNVIEVMQLLQKTA
jgi:catechol 2,3-dioxygenase-like lactoylglutathione lyase family enzyme